MSFAIWASTYLTFITRGVIKCVVVIHIRHLWKHEKSMWNGNETCIYIAMLGL